jgi:hypothetical protein
MVEEEDEEKERRRIFSRNSRAPGGGTMPWRFPSGDRGGSAAEPEREAWEAAVEEEAVEEEEEVGAAGLGPRRSRRWP